ncbi:hypothetical protein Patl1_07321 [Pistacia atlantica]|uniref:Uncharacterized protein n=1 Tax=Pistacia atlantica TaxID=434234 RepID=A0ACC1AJA1_9ROSI|nr:hypothetical protein Patl1_07321 [Pistacia atlantica]
MGHFPFHRRKMIFPIGNDVMIRLEVGFLI